MRKIGIMGGTFDPIHNGHIMLGRQAYAEYNLDEVWYMPSGQPPHKKGRHVTESAERCHMVKLAIQDIPYFVFSDFEVRRTGKNTYTAETLALLGRNTRMSLLFYRRRRFSLRDRKMVSSRGGDGARHFNGGPP